MTISALAFSKTDKTPATEGLVRCEDDARWDDFVARSPHGSPFVRSWFLRTLGASVERWLLLVGARAVAGAVLLTDDGVVLEAPQPYSPYQGLMLAPETAGAVGHRAGKEIAEVTQALLDALQAEYGHLSFCLHPEFRDLRGLQWFRYGRPDMFRLDLRYTGLIDLAAGAGFDAYLAGLRSTRRYEYRRAIAHGLVAETSQDVDMLEALHAATFGRQGIVRSAREARLLRAMVEDGLAAGVGELLVCRAPSGAPASATYFVRDERCAYYLFGANAPEHRALGGNAFLVIETVKRCLEIGLRRLDLCGVNSPQRGDFKTSLGARVAPYFHATWTRQPE